MDLLKLRDLEHFVERLGNDLVNGEITVDEFIVRIRDYVEQLVREEQG